VVLDPLDDEQLLARAFFCFDEQRLVLVRLVIRRYLRFLFEPVFDLDEELLEADGVSG